MSTSATPNEGRIVSQVSVSRHAKQRYLERVNPAEPFPASAISEEFETSEPVEIKGFEDATRQNPDTGVVYVFDDDTLEVITVFEPTAPQLAHDVEPEASPSAGWRETYEQMGVNGGGHR